MIRQLTLMIPIAIGMQNFYSDIVYSCKTKGEEKIKIAILLEHKSNVPKHPQFQLGQYIQGIWLEDYKNEINNREPDYLTFVLPIILYHGHRKWKKRPFSDSFKLPDPIFSKFIPNFEYILIDLSKYNDDFILNLDKSFLLNTLLAFKHKNDTNYIKKHFKRLFTNVQTFLKSMNGRNFFRTFLGYLIKTTKIKGRELSELVEQMPVIKSDVMTLYEDILLEGKKMGKNEKAKEIIIALIKELPFLTDQKIAKIASMPINFVQNIRKQLTKLS